MGDEPDVLAPVAHQRRETGGRQAFHDFGAMGEQTGGAAVPPWTVGRERQQQRQAAKDTVADGDGFVAGIDADVDVQAEGDELTAHVLERLQKIEIARLIGGRLILPARERVRGGPIKGGVGGVGDRLDDF